MGVGVGLINIFFKKGGEGVSETQSVVITTLLLSYFLL